MQGEQRAGDIESAISRNAGVPEVSAAWTAQNLKRVRVLDVREDDELMGPLGHIDGLRHIPLNELHRAAVALPSDESLVVVCRSGARSGAAAAALEKIGFKRVASMAGGMLAWNELGFPVVRHPHR